jgi:hypothetical protein
MQRWRPEPESNRRARICSPLRNHSAIGPRTRRAGRLAGLAARRNVVGCAFAFCRRLGLGSGLIDPEDEGCSEFDGGEEDVCAAVVACVDASPVFESSEHVLDAVPLSIEHGIVGQAGLAFCVRRDAGHDPALVEGFAEPVAVIGSIGEQDVSLGQQGFQCLGANMIVALAFGEMKPQGAAATIAHDMELGRQPASAAPDTSR